jgi:hypothetical protein
VIDGKAGPEFDEVGFLLFDATRKNSAYWAKIEKSSYVVLNNKKGEPFESVGTLKFSSDGKHLFYDAVRDGKHIVFSDTSALEQYDKIRDYAISADGKHFAYHISMPPSDEEFSHFVVVDGKKEGPYEEIMSGSMTFSPDGSEISYGGQRPVHEMVNGEEKEVDAYEWFLVRNGKENTRYNMLQGIIVYSADGKHLAYGGEKYTKRLVNLDGNEGAEYDDIYFIEFTPDSKWLIYTVKNNNKEFVVVNDVEGRPYDFLPGQKEFVIDSPTSFHYVAMKGKIIYLVEETIE